MFLTNQNAQLCNSALWLVKHFWKPMNRRFYVRKLCKINYFFIYVCSNFGPLLLFNAAAIDYQLQKSIWHMQMSLFCLLLPAWCLIIFGTKLLHICAWPHFWFMKQLIWSLVNLRAKLFMVYSAHQIQQPILNLRILNVLESQIAFDKKPKNIGRKIRERLDDS